MSAAVVSTAEGLRGLSVKSCAARPEPGRTLMCPPDHFDVLEVKNPLMAGQVGRVNRGIAVKQWRALKELFESLGSAVSQIEPVSELEDMVFCANQSLVGLGSGSERVCLLSAMRHASRRREVPAFERFFAAQGYRVERLKGPYFFEGGGDAVWHPGRRLLWGGHGFRSEPEAYEEASRVFSCPVLLLKLVNERFYHLDTCFCPLTPEAVLVYPPAFDRRSLELILKVFPVVIPAEPAEAERLACNSAVVGKTAVMPVGCPNAARRVEAIGMKVIEADTSEFIKSGGSVYCLKTFFY